MGSIIFKFATAALGKLFEAAVSFFQARADKQDTFDAGATKAALNARERELAQAVRATEITMKTRAMSASELKKWL